MARFGTYNFDDPDANGRDSSNLDKFAGDNSVFVDEAFYAFADRTWAAPDKNVARVRAMAYINSGTRMDMNITVISERGYPFKLDDRSVATLEFLNPGPYSKLTSNKVVASKGVYIFKQINVKMRPGSTEYLKVTFDKFFSFDQTKDKLDFLDAGSEPLIILTARHCRRGEYYSYERTCVKCPDGTYTFTAQTAPQSGCPPCPLDSVCKDGKLYPGAGHVRMHTSSQVVVACFDSAACLAGDDDYPLKHCAEGYEGVMCATCSKGYWKPKNTHQCLPCSYTGAARNNRNIAVLVLFSVITFLVYRQIIRNFGQPRQEAAAIFRILINNQHYLYILNALQDSQYPLGAYATLKLFVDNMSSFSFPASSIIAEDCMDKDIDPVASFYYQVTAMICLGPGVLLLTFIMFLVFTKIAKMCADGNKNKNINWQRLKNRTAIVTGLVLFMIYPQIVELLLQSVNCFPSLMEEGPYDTPIYRVRINP